MTTEAKFKYALKEMMKEKPLSDINVTALCKKCGCHRQTFYYHYQDIFDLLAAIILNEEVPGLAGAETPQAILYSFFGYAKHNFTFLKSVYFSAAHELVDDFFYTKILTRLLPVLLKEKKYKLTLDGYRLTARRYAQLIGDEYAYAFKDSSLDAEGFTKAMRKFTDLSLKYILPALAEEAGRERGKTS